MQAHNPNDPHSSDDRKSAASDQTVIGEEISLRDIVHFLQESWKKLVIAAVAGAVLGLAGWFFLASYSAEYVLPVSYTHLTLPTNREV